MSFKYLLILPLLVASLQAASEADLTFALNADSTEYSVSDCDQNASGSLDIPSIHNGLPVTSIDDFAFRDCTSLTSITIPDSVTSIGSGAFFRCSGLTSFIIPNSVTSIGSSAFYVQGAFFTEDFETDGQDVGTGLTASGDQARYTASTPFNDGINDHWNRTDGGNIGNVSGAYSSFSGTYFWAAEDTDNPAGNGEDEQTLDITNIDITGKTGLQFKGLFGAGNESGVGVAKYDSVDFIKVQARIDGGDYNDVLWFSYLDTGGSDNHNEPFGVDRDFDGLADSVDDLLGTALQSYSADISGTGSTLDIRIIVHMEYSGEEIAFDNIQILEVDPNIINVISDATTGGSVTPLGVLVHTEPTEITLTATANNGYVFGYWSGGVPEELKQENPLTVTVVDDGGITAVFSQDSSDSDGDGLSQYQEVIVYGTDPVDADSDDDGFDDGFEVETGYSPMITSSTPDAYSEMLTAVEFRFGAANGVSYRIESSSDLENWPTVEAEIIGSGARVTRFYSVEGTQKRFYRAKRND